MKKIRTCIVFSEEDGATMSQNKKTGQREKNLESEVKCVTVAHKWLKRLEKILIIISIKLFYSINNFIILIF